MPSTTGPAAPLAAAFLLVLLPLAGCVQAHSGQGGKPDGSSAPNSWSSSRLAHAKALVHHPGTSRTARSTPASARVGALFAHDTSGDHFCTASVVASPGKSLLITAAHCVHGGGRGGYNRDIVFAPAYRNGRTPDGIWQPSSIVVDPRWAASGDPDHDVAFIVLKPLNGKRIAEVLGANRLGTDKGFANMVRITGYPANGDEPITCSNRSTQQSAHQMRIVCTGYSGGTSGSPWLTGFDPVTQSGSVIGVIGGYQHGGSTDDVSYSPYFDASVRKLYGQAVAREK
ncbi:serine protease [Streptomyces morookaense]|uniref:trypsin-like serine peptidase n=1 Tax=Streptomyces morookaense TaxID=1970 RepID=UPI0033D1694D